MESVATGASRNQARRVGRLLLALGLVVLLGLSAGGARRASAQTNTNTLPTTTAVPAGGTLTIALSPAGFTITSSTPVTGCPVTGIGTATVTYTCSPTSGGIGVGTPIVQTFAGSSGGPTSETVTYNANGPISATLGATAATAATGNCAIPNPALIGGNLQGTATCAVQSTVATVPGGTFAVTATGTVGGSQTVQVSQAPPTLGGCPLTTVVPTAISTVAGSETVTYTCSTGQIPAGTTARVQVGFFGGCFGEVPAIAASQNANAATTSLPGSPAVPSPTTQTVTLGSGASPSTGFTTPTPQGFSVSYQPGWNIVAGPAGTIVTGANGPLYTFQPGNTNYQAIQSGSALRSGLGYWAYFTSASTTGIGISGPQTISVTVPARQWVMVGNPGNSTATISGADTAYVFDPSINNYTAQTTLAAGQGAWVISNAGGTITVANAGRSSLPTPATYC